MLIFKGLEEKRKRIKKKFSLFGTKLKSERNQCKLKFVSSGLCIDAKNEQTGAVWQGLRKLNDEEKISMKINYLLQCR